MLSSRAPGRSARILRAGGVIRTYEAVVDGCRDAQREGLPVNVYAMETAADEALRELRAVCLGHWLLVPTHWVRE